MVEDAMKRMHLYNEAKIDTMTEQRINDQFKMLSLQKHPDKLKKGRDMSDEEFKDAQEVRAADFTILTCDAFLLKEFIRARETTDKWKPFLPAIRKAQMEAGRRDSSQSQRVDSF